ncbi:protein tesmin/TSO1-like CXC 2 [Actinidia eriantha]|uniref:protein tesmin/TSO1-like CXC 2 n=1 Tax=Actinidia eriantha TaxID=165200 RepID=UPI00258617ED|nr:protein tesmin/TSO1-like CXC 2 [Actinidia eriantha]
MTTPQTPTPTTANSQSDSVAIQDSAIFGDISNLSPVKPLKDAPMVSGFLEFRSPSPVFTSPRVNKLQGTTSLKRPQCSQLCSAESSQQDFIAEEIAVSSNEFEKSNIQGSSALAPVNCIEKECINNCSVQDQTANPSGHIDEYLADAVIDCANSTHSASLSLIQSDDVLQSLTTCPDSIEMVPERDRKTNTGQDEEKALDAFPATTELAGQDFEGKSSFDINPIETDTNHGVSKMPPSVGPKDEFDLSLYHAFEKQQCEILVAQITKELDCASQHLQSNQGYEDCTETTREDSNKPIENMILPCPKGKQDRGMHRRCLQFEDAQLHTMASSPGSWSSSNIVSNSKILLYLQTLRFLNHFV